MRVHNETPGIVVPENVQERYRAAGPDAAAVGVELVRGLIDGARSLAAGVYVVAPFRRPLGVLDVLVAGAHVVVLGRSMIVGKPLALLLMQKAPGGNATVTVVHSRSRNLRRSRAPPTF